MDILSFMVVCYLHKLHKNLFFLLLGTTENIGYITKALTEMSFFENDVHRIRWLVRFKEINCLHKDKAYKTPWKNWSDTWLTGFPDL